MTKLDLVTPYHDYFRMVAADTEALRREVYRLRYKVYCAELGWEESERFPEQMEFDAYDEHSSHCLLQYRGDDSYIGCVRLVKAGTEPGRPVIPLLEHCAGKLDSSALDISALPRDSYGEISRLAIEGRFRRRPGESENPAGIGTEEMRFGEDERRRFPHVALGLYLGAASIGLDSGMSGVFAMMEPRLARLLKISGIHFRQVGETLEYRGVRAPFYISRERLFGHLRPEMKRLLGAIEEDLWSLQEPVGADRLKRNSPGVN